MRFLDMALHVKQFSRRAFIPIDGIYIFAITGPARVYSNILPQGFPFGVHQPMIETIIIACNDFQPVGARAEISCRVLMGMSLVVR